MNLSGNLLSEPNENNDRDKKIFEQIGISNHNFYRRELNSFHGPAAIAGVYDMFSTMLMWMYAPGAASSTNFLVSIADFLQVPIAKTKLLGDPDANSERGDIARQRRVGAMAWTQVLAGIGGLFSFFLELFSKHEEDTTLSTSKKSLLSGTSLLAGLTMLTTFSEKMLVATTSKGKVNNEIKGIVLDANADARASTEYLVMAFYPWVRSIEFLKRAIDTAIPFLSIRDGLCNFVNDGISKVFANEPNIKLSKGTKKLLKNTLLITNGEKHNPENIKLPRILGSNWFFNMRERYLMPVFRFLGCKNTPVINLESNNGENILVVQTPTPKEPASARKTEPEARILAPSSKAPSPTTTQKRTVEREAALAS